jgi:hypothetical protein
MPRCRTLVLAQRGGLGRRGGSAVPAATRKADFFICFLIHLLQQLYAAAQLQLRPTAVLVGGDAVLVLYDADQGTGLH